MKMNIGDKMAIHCYKHNGKLERISDEATILDIKEDYIVVANYKTKLTESDGRSHKTAEPAIIFFYNKRWFNVIAQLKKKGLYYYCNIATPYLIDDNIIKYIDYDLDLRVFPDWGYRVLDKNEYNYHRQLMKYPPEIDFIIKKELDSLIDMEKKRQGPFDKQLVDMYKEQYSKIIKKSL
jgi:protein associated with RNAse G/E